MFGSSILDLAIGLIFVFLVVSLIVTAVSELIASWLKWRTTNLEEGDPEPAATEPNRR